MNIFDLHCDSIMKMYKGEHLGKMEDCHISTGKLSDGGCLAQCFAIFVPRYEAAARFGMNDTPEVYFEAAYKAYKRELQREREHIREAFSIEDIINNRDNGYMSSILTVEDGVTLNGSIDNVDRYYDIGVRMVALTWNYENTLGYPNSSDPLLHSRGLKPFGIEALRRMNEVGIAVDVSHLSEGGFMDAARYSSKPFIASHSCARALCDHSRNLTDEQLHILGDRGGIVGINFYSRFLSPDSDYSSLDDVVRHALHIRDKAGIEALALGSDFDGIECELEWKDYSGYPKILDALCRVFTDDEVDLISNGNAMRVFRDIIGH